MAGASSFFIILIISSFPTCLRLHSPCTLFLFYPTHYTLAYPDKALTVTNRPFHRVSFPGDRPSTRRTPRLEVEAVPIQPTLLISFLGHIPGRAFAHPPSEAAQKPCTIGKSAWAGHLGVHLERAITRWRAETGQTHIFP